jgi:hypothetical protein
LTGGSSAVTPLTLSSPTKVTAFPIILWRCWAAIEHGITQPRPHDLRWVVRRAAGPKPSPQQANTVVIRRVRYGALRKAHWRYRHSVFYAPIPRRTLIDNYNFRADQHSWHIDAGRKPCDGREILQRAAHLGVGADLAELGVKPPFRLALDLDYARHPNQVGPQRAGMVINGRHPILPFALCCTHIVFLLAYATARFTEMGRC